MSGTIHKPPLGCKPGFMVYPQRIIELAEAIIRNAEDLHDIHQVTLIRHWAIELDDVAGVLLGTWPSDGGAGR